jgi:predicted transglutaminase-like cysteine proteinase
VRTIAIWAAAGLLGALAQVGSAPAALAQTAFAAYSEIALRAETPFPKWQGVRERLATESATVARCLRAQACGSPVAAKIAQRMQGLPAESRLVQAEAVHRLVNARPYREDQRQFGRGDVWQAPFAFWGQGGDCEDYAIAKYMALTALGFAPEQLRLTVLTSRMRREVHAVLLIEIDGAWYVADNLRRSLHALDRYEGWKPLYSVSDAGAWRYVARPLGEQQELAGGAPAADLEPAVRRLAQSEPNRSRL